MNVDEFLQHVREHDLPEPGWTPPLRAIWHAENGDWDAAHEACQEVDTPDGAWVHACLHREEGDISNARYWYDRAGRPESEDSIENERRKILRALLI